jgi:hypothetical protein
MDEESPWLRNFDGPLLYITYYQLEHGITLRWLTFSRTAV